MLITLPPVEPGSLQYNRFLHKEGFFLWEDGFFPSEIKSNVQHGPFEGNQTFPFDQ